jgi:hypothetical protein
MKDLSGRTTIVEFPQPANAGTIQSEIADAADPTVAASLLDRYEPEAVILVAGASPHTGLRGSVQDKGLTARNERVSL